jgi:HNH endonuclease
MHGVVVYKTIMQGDDRQKIFSRITVDESTGCWNSEGATNGRGNVWMAWGGRKRKVDQVAWEIFRGGIGVGKELDHICENRRCCNPEHMVEVDKQWHLEVSPRNVTWKNRNKTHCVNGHEYTEENTIRRAGGGRDCRACNNARQKKFQRKRKAGVEVELVL